MPGRIGLDRAASGVNRMGRPAAIKALVLASLTAGGIVAGGLVVGSVVVTHARAGECLGCAGVDIERIGSGPRSIQVVRGIPPRPDHAVLIAAAPGADLVVHDRRPGGPYSDPLGREPVRLLVMPAHAVWTGAKVIAVPVDSEMGR